MNADLVEIVTRLVIERLSEVPQTKTRPLSEKEIHRWNSVSQNLWRPECGTQSLLRPLNDTDITRWNDITSSMPFSANETTRSDKTKQEFVTFEKY